MIEGARVLIVDDIEENLRVLTETLTTQGISPLQAKNGERALQIADKAQPDLILLDIKMPGMDGYETIAELKKNPRTSEIPVIFISALNQIDDKLKGFQAGAVDYVSKPFQKEEVLARVSTHLKLRQSQLIIEQEKEKSDQLLLNVLPAAVAQELKDRGSSEPQHFSNVSVMFTDFVEFTQATEDMSPPVLISELNEMFTHFDQIIQEMGCERIKTIGDAYLAVCGMPHPQEDHAFRMITAAQKIRDYLRERNREGKYKWTVRIGIHSGDVVGGIVGTKKYLYDVFGDAVNTASRMESMSQPMGINVSEDTWKLVNDQFSFEEREPVEVKGKGTMKMYILP